MSDRKQAAPLHSDASGSLYRLDVSDGEPIFAVQVHCPSTGRMYLLRVPPTVRTAREAVAWTFDVPAEAYRPFAET